MYVAKIINTFTATVNGNVMNIVSPGGLFGVGKSVQMKKIKL